MIHTLATLALAGFAVMPLVGCRNVLGCGPALVITPNFDSTSVGGTRTFQALAESGGCGLTKTAAAPANAVVWRVHDTTVARISAITSDDVLTVTGVRPGQTPIVASRLGLTAVAYFQVN